ncbi:SR-related and CTD-associated factor 4 [Adelges cooleyi]|uniref:SR-related and CTD-associated factor 4 n=1 Tax=Adelges cooleyi TaxID=133065 RepID=UPI00217F26D8|nr:SR-related and CTD-associated factor 4 [Adelges cooleyi]
MDAVKAFTAELYSITEMKPPISKAKMTAITRNAIKAIKLYKHVVQCVEKFIHRCKPEYKIPGLYVIDSIVRQSRHQFGNDKDVFAPRFARNLKSTFSHLFVCAEEDKSKVIRVLNLWQKNAVFTTDVIQPIFDLAANPEHEEPNQTNPLSSIENSPKISVKTDIFKSQDNIPCKDNSSKSFDSLQGLDNDKTYDPAIIQHLQAIQSLLKKQPNQSSSSPQLKKSDSVKLFDKKLLDYDYGEEEDEMLNQSPEFQQQQQHQNTSLEGLDSLLSNPEVLRTLRNVEGLMSTQSKQQAELDKIKEMRKEAEFDKHLAQTVQNLPFASECELKPAPMISQSIGAMPNLYTNQLYNTQIFQQQQPLITSDIHHKPAQQLIGYEDPNQAKQPEVIDLDHIASPPHQKQESRRENYGTSSSRKRSPRRSSRERQREREKERERDRERRKKYLPSFRKNHLAVVSTTLWVGHLSKLIHQDDLYGLFQPIGDIVSLNLISPRGCAFLCMNRRQDAARILHKFQGEKLQGKPISVAWAPGQAMKDKEWKDYWEVEDGVSYIPWEKLNKDIDYDELEVGGMLDEESMPEWLKSHLKNLRDSKKSEKKEEKMIDGNQQVSNIFDQQGVQSSPSVQMQMSPAQNSQPNQISFNIPHQAMGMPNPFGINTRLINPMINPMMPGSMTPLGMGHPSMMMMNRMQSPFGPPPNMSMMGNPQQMGITNDGQKPLGVPPDMVMPFPFNMNLPSQAAISSAQSMMGLNPSIVTSSSNSVSNLPPNSNQKDVPIVGNNQLDPSTMMQFNLPPPPTLPNLSDFRHNDADTSLDNDKYDPTVDREGSNDGDRSMDRNRGRDNRNRSRDNRDRNNRFKDRDGKNDRGRRVDDMRLDPRSRNNKGSEQRERKSSRWGDKEEANNQNHTDRAEGLGIPPPNLTQMDNVNDVLIQQNDPLRQIFKHAIPDNVASPGFQPEMFVPNGPLPNQMFNMPPQGLGLDGPRFSLMDTGNMRGRGAWNRGGRGGFRGTTGGFNNNSGPNWDANNGANWENNSGPNWDSNRPPPVWQNQQNRGGMMGRGNIRPPLMGNMGRGRGRDIWVDNNLQGGRSNREPDTWGSRGGRDADKWGGRGGRDSDGWSGHGNRSSPWRGNAGRRRTDDREGVPNQKRWRREENPEWDEQKPWKRNDDADWQTNKHGPQWNGKKDDGSHSKFKSRDNDERPRKPSKWGDKPTDDKLKEDDLKSSERIVPDEDPNAKTQSQCSAPMDLENYDGESSENLEQKSNVQPKETFSDNEFKPHCNEQFEREHHENTENRPNLSSVDDKTYNESQECLTQNSSNHQITEQYDDKQNSFSDNFEESKHDNYNVSQEKTNDTHENFEKQNIETQDHYERTFHNEYNSAPAEFETDKNDSELTQIEDVESKSNNGYGQNEQNYQESGNNFVDSSYNQENNDFVPHYDEKELSTDKPCEQPQGSFYFGSDNEPTINDSIEMRCTELPSSESISTPENSDVLDTTNATDSSTVQN